MRLVPLTQGMFTAVDDEDYEKGMAHKWYCGRSKYTGYALRGIRKSRSYQTVRLHNFLLGVEKIGTRMVVDHIDGNGLNNTKANLRLITKGENNRNKCSLPKHNTSGHIGVKRHDTRWGAYIRARGKNYWLGIFEHKEEAIAARKAAEKKYWNLDIAESDQSCNVQFARVTRE